MSELLAVVGCTLLGAVTGAASAVVVCRRWSRVLVDARAEDEAISLEDENAIRTAAGQWSARHGRPGWLAAEKLRLAVRLRDSRARRRWPR